MSGLPERLAREVVAGLGAPLNERSISVSVDELREHERAVAAAIRDALDVVVQVARGYDTSGLTPDQVAEFIATAIEALKGET